MAEQRDLTKILDNVEEDLRHAQPPAPAPTRASVVESFAPQKYRDIGRGDSLEQIQQDLRKMVADMESRFKTLMDELKRIAS